MLRPMGRDTTHISLSNGVLNTNTMDNAMRITLALVVAISVSAAAASDWAKDAKTPAPADAQQTPSTFPPPTKEKCDNPNALGVEPWLRSTTGGPGFGFQNFKAYDFLKDHEVVLTFDDGPWPGNTVDRCLRDVR